MKFILRLFAKSGIRISGGKAHCAKGKLTIRLLSDVSLLAAEFDIEQGEIWIGHDGRVSFSGGIPEAVHQRIRNVISASTSQ